MLQLDTRGLFVLFFLCFHGLVVTQTTTPSASPTIVPTLPPTISPTIAPTIAPSTSPTAAPTEEPLKVWVPDSIIYTTDLARFPGTSTWQLNLTIDSNGPIYEDNIGHFRLKISIDYGNGTANRVFQPTTCLNIEGSGPTLAAAIKRSPLLLFDLPNEMDNILQPRLSEPHEELSRYIQVHAKRYYNDFGTTNTAHTAFALTMKILESRNISALHVSLLTDGVSCSSPHTYGHWDDASRWEAGTVPNTTDAVIIPSQAGTIIINRDVTVQALNMSGGLIVNYETYCPKDWSTDPRGFRGSKCYRSFSAPLPFAAAERRCNSAVGAGSTGRHLVHIRDAEEMVVALRMCRGMKGSEPFNKGCWIGLQDPLGNGDFRWISPPALELPSTAGALLGAQAVSWYSDWRRQEPNNHSLSEAVPSPALRGGERCAHIVPWQEDPLVLEQGSWNDNSCELSKPYLCQMFGDTMRYTLHSTDAVVINRGAVQGGILSTGAGASRIYHAHISRGGSLIVSADSYGTSIGTVLLEQGSSLVVEAQHVQLMSGAFIGELVSIFQQTESSTVSVISSTYSFSFSDIADSTEETDATTTAAAEVSDRINATAFRYEVSSATVFTSSITSAAALTATPLSLQPLILIAANATLYASPLCDDSTAATTTATTATTTADPYNERSTYSGLLQNGSCDAEFSEVIINARIEATGQFIVANATRILIPQTADLSQAAVIFDGENAEMKLLGYSSRLSAYDAFNLNVSHRGPVMGEYSANFTEEQLNQHEQQFRGVYRLRVFNPRLLSNISSSSSSSSSVSNVTACIPYNATAAQLKSLLDELPQIQQRGFVTVRRYGDGSSSEFRFGFTYRIEMDAPPTSSYDTGPLHLAVDCYGLEPNCQCAETLVPLIDFRGVPQCPSGSSYSQTLPNSCVIAPVIAVSRVTTLAHANITGPGSVIIEDGVHRLPPRSDTTVTISRGTGVVAADVIDWLALRVTGTGRLVTAGTGWTAWDSSYLLYAPEWTYARGLTSLLGLAAPCNMYVNSFFLNGYGSVLSSSPMSNITWNNGIWGGGLIGGRSTLYLQGNMQVDDANKSLRYGMTLWVLSGATMEWTSGNISLTDGADIIMEGNFTINSAKTGTEVFVGMSQLLEAADTDVIGRLLLQQSPGRNFHSYYGDELPAELRGGWYQNPLCGDQCLYTNHLIVRAFGVVEITSNSSVTFQLPLDLIGQSRVNIGNSVTKTLASGGICGNDVVIDVSSGTTMELSGGQMSMKATCTIQGEGELLVTAGSHSLAFSIDAHITIDGGTLLWPEANGPNQVIKFNGGLLIQNTGELQVQPFSTTVLISKEVIMTDKALIQFPLLGIAAQASPFDEPDAPDPSPRGNLTATGVMRLSGGTLRGKADFNALDALFLDNDVKYIQSLAKLVNKGHCEWANGDLITSDNGEFLNLGTVQMARGNSQFFSNALYKGTELPVDNGGDVFALEYHSWDTDNGGLDYSEYVRQRTEFVSRAPDGWTVEQQTAGVGNSIR